MEEGKKLELLTGLLKEATELNYSDGEDKILKRSEMLIKKVFGLKSDYVKKLNEISFTPMYVIGEDDGVYRSSFEYGKEELVNLVQVMVEDIELSIVVDEPISNKNKEFDSGNSSEVFIVHGHNEEMKQACARFVSDVDLKPIILHEQANNGRTIIEKFTDHANVSFSIVLISADDIAYSRTQQAETAKFRARQNVILELGFFLGKLGRERVVVLHEKIDNLEIPSDYQGVIYIPYDDGGNWKFAIAKELKSIGFNIDANKLL